jgi:catechol 2,3-dioxygenase-like lactoylglutathione lyase family enzyme
MPILRPEKIIYGVEDLAAGVRYFEDWGLELLESGDAGAEFKMPENQHVVLRLKSDPDLPASPEAGSTAHEVVWGVTEAADLERLGAELAKDRDVKTDADGTLHSFDESGFGIGFMLAARTPVEITAPDLNFHNNITRLNQTVMPPPRVKPLRMGHVVYEIKKADAERASAFYTDRIGFKLTDRCHDIGDFLRVPGLTDHHSLFLNFRPDVVQFSHIAFEVDDIDAVMVGGGYMSTQGWETASGPGRHYHGSNIFWYTHNPSGGTTEYFSDMDRMDDDWQPRIFEQGQGYASWLVGGRP